MTVGDHNFPSIHFIGAEAAVDGRWMIRKSQAVVAILHVRRLSIRIHQLQNPQNSPHFRLSMNISIFAPFSSILVLITLRFKFIEALSTDFCVLPRPMEVFPLQFVSDS